MANRTSCWIFGLKLYLFKIYVHTQPWAILMHNFNLNVPLCADLIRTVFAPIFIALILKGIWTKRDKGILIVHVVREENIVIVLIKKNPNKMILFLYLVYQMKSPHTIELWTKRSNSKDEQTKSPVNTSVPCVTWLDSRSKFAQPALYDGRAAELQPPPAVMFWTWRYQICWLLCDYNTAGKDQRTTNMLFYHQQSGFSINIRALGLRLRWPPLQLERLFTSTGWLMMIKDSSDQ